eukprot:TRINITY_DN3837_c0_g1_i23.p1 TRINITY_DN3837_c0_g1~~TRINITY_DN3837_c0_g1_i23.p1  ORF type:complete len:319 (-),score=77.54 TRINITY_DN3837_c0_g1_i23:166-1101(-)
MIRRPPRSTHCISSAASDVYKRQVCPFTFVYTCNLLPAKKKAEYALYFPFTYDKVPVPHIKPAKNAVCDKCREICREGEAVRNMCGHEICKGCVRRMKECVCPVARCNRRMRLGKICEVVGREWTEELVKNMLKGCCLNELVICPNAACSFKLKAMNKDRVQTCPNCQAVFCVLCGTNHNAGNCPNRKLYKDIYAKLYADYSSSCRKETGESLELLLRPCPYCLSFLPAHPLAGEVVCPRCGQSLCANKSCKLSLVRTHGLGYHRKKCEKLKEVAAEELGECAECKKAGKLCSPPMDLDEDDDIPESERNN